MKTHLIFLTILLTVIANANQINSKSGAKLMLDQPALTLEPALYNQEWGYHSAAPEFLKDSHDNRLSFSISPYGKGKIEGFAIFSQTKGRTKAEYHFTAKADLSLKSLFIGSSLNIRSFAGGSWKTDTKSGTLPSVYKNLMLMRAQTTSCTLTTADGSQTATFEFPEKTSIMIQDNRQWSESYALRIGYISDINLKRGDQRRITFTLTATGQPILKQQKPIILKAGPDWIPLTVKLDIIPGSATDLSQQGFIDAPAGKHGRLIVKDSHFVFEKTPDKTQRFYGVNFCFSANYLENDAAEKIAQRLTRIGYNSIRIHHHDSQMTSGSPDGTELNTDEMKKFDTFTAACIKEGIYISTDLFVSRRVQWKAVGIDKPGSIPMDIFKMMVPVHEGVYNNLKEYTVNWLSHLNPHTGRSYAQEPALAWINIINEGNFGNKFNMLKAIPEWQQAWQTWLIAKQSEDPQNYGSISKNFPNDLSMIKPDPHKAAFILFMRDLEIKMMKRFRALLRDELGCRALISNANGWAHYVPDQYVRTQHYDYVDDHFYVDHPRFLKNKWRLPSFCPNTNPVKNSNSGGRTEIYMRLFNKPFTISEYNYSAPGRFRGVGGILTGTLAALQDWDGLWRFGYSHNGEALSSMQSKKMNYFDMMNDPLSLAAERASICLFLRADLKPLKKSALIFFPEKTIDSITAIYPRTKNLWGSLGWSHKTGSLVGSRMPDGFSFQTQFPDVYRQYKADSSIIPFIGSTTKDLLKLNKAISINNESGTFIITTEKTCGGFTESGAVNAGALTFDVNGTAATIWISSLDNKPLKSSSRMLLTHLTDIQNTNIHYAEEERQTLLDWGTLPHLVRNGNAKISIALLQPELFKVYALETDGSRVGEIPVKVVKGRLCFNAKTATFKANATIIYEIIKK